jgi:hypothetical protein
MFDDEKSPATFVRYASDILADTNAGLSGNDIIRETASYAVEYDVVLPHPAYPFGAANKRMSLYDHLMAFNARSNTGSSRSYAGTALSGTTRVRSARNSRLGWRRATRNSRSALPRPRSTRR